MAATSIPDALNAFRTTLALSNQVVVAAHGATVSTATALATYERRLVTEAAFVKVFVAFETFIQDTFLLYMTGQSSLKGNTLLCYARPRDLGHANLLTIGTITRKFIDWNTPANVDTLANLFFDPGNPYERHFGKAGITVASMQQAKTVRNACVHMDGSTSKQLLDLAQGQLPTALSSITPYEFLTATDPKVKGNTIMKSYFDAFAAAAQDIAEA